MTVVVTDRATAWHVRVWALALRRLDRLAPGRRKPNKGRGGGGRAEKGAPRRVTGK